MRAYLDQRFAAASERRQALMDEWMAACAAAATSSICTCPDV